MVILDTAMISAITTKNLAEMQLNVSSHVRGKTDLQEIEVNQHQLETMFLAVMTSNLDQEVLQAIQV